MDSPDDLRRTVASRVPPGARIDVEVFPSGAVGIDIRSGNDFAVIQSTADRNEWGYDVNPPEEESFTGFENVAGSLDSALSAVVEGL